MAYVTIMVLVLVATLATMQQNRWQIPSFVSSILLGLFVLISNMSPLNLSW